MPLHFSEVLYVAGFDLWGKKRSGNRAQATICLLTHEMVKYRVTSFFLFAWNFLGFSTENSVSWETPQSQAG